MRQPIRIERRQQQRLAALGGDDRQELVVGEFVKIFADQCSGIRNGDVLLQLIRRFSGFFGRALTKYAVQSGDRRRS
jgi:hypothetical protein